MFYRTLYSNNLLKVSLRCVLQLPAEHKDETILFQCASSIEIYHLQLFVALTVLTPQSSYLGLLLSTFSKIVIKILTLPIFLSYVLKLFNVIGS